METRIIEGYRRRAQAQLRPYLRAVHALRGEDELECPVCHANARLDACDHWNCFNCDGFGDVVDYVKAQNPMLDDWNCIRRIHRKLHMKIVDLETISGEELQQMEFAEREYLLRPLLVREGVFLLAAPPKSGKSWFVLQLAAALVKGEPFLGFETRRCAVLYLCLEDYEQRIQERAAATGCLGSPDIYFAKDAELLGFGLEEGLEGFLESHPKVGLVVVDTLQRVREAADEQYSYAGEYEVMNRFKAIAERRHVAIVLVHHTNKKEETGDVTNLISGTTAMSGGVDCAMVLRRKSRLGTEATLHVVSRDTADCALQLDFDRDSRLWRFLGYDSAEREEGDDGRTRFFDAVAELIASDGEWVGTAGELCEALGEEASAAPVSAGRWLRGGEEELACRGVGMDVSRSSSRRVLHLWRRAPEHDR